MSNVYPQKKTVLVGYMASGKSTVANILSNKLQRQFIDTDILVEKKCKALISEIFENKDELLFRKIEHQVFDELINAKNEAIISTGGGLPCYFNNHHFFKLDHVISIYLKYQPQTIVDRLVLNKIKRPIVAQIEDNKLLEFVSKHLFERNFYYIQAKHIVKCDNKSIEEIVDECLGLIINDE